MTTIDDLPEIDQRLLDELLAMEVDAVLDVVRAWANQTAKQGYLITLTVDRSKAVLPLWWDNLNRRNET